MTSYRVFLKHREGREDARLLVHGNRRTAHEIASEIFRVPQDCIHLEVAAW